MNVGKTIIYEAATNDNHFSNFNIKHNFSYALCFLWDTHTLQIVGYSKVANHKTVWPCKCSQSTIEPTANAFVPLLFMCLAI